MLTNFLFQVVCIMLELNNPVSTDACFFPILSNGGGEEIVQLFRALVGNANMIFEWLNR